MFENKEFSKEGINSILIEIQKIPGGLATS